MNRGSLRDPAGQLRDRNRFNEAPIHESGKFRDPKVAIRVCFASMRPRFMNRGSQLARP